MYAVTIYNFTFPISKELYIKRKRPPRLFKLYQALFIWKKLTADDDTYLGCNWSKKFFSYKRADFSVIVNISVKTLWCYAVDAIFAFFYIFHFFQIILVSLFLAWNNELFIMFKDSNLPTFHSKQNIIILQFILLIAITYSRGENKKKNCCNDSLIKSTICLLIFCQKLMIFERSPNSLK